MIFNPTNIEEKLRLQQSKQIAQPDILKQVHAIFDAENEKEINIENELKSANSSTSNLFNVELLKAFDFGIYVNPFLKAGFGAGYLETNADVTNKSLTYGSFNLGAGIFIPIGESFDIELAYENKNVSYQKPDSTYNDNPTSNLHVGYVGFNIRY